MSKEFTALAEDIKKDYSPSMVKDKNRKFAVNSIPSGSLNLDYALGKGGWPMGTIVQVYGPRDVGKSSMIGLNAIANAQKMGLKCAIISVESGFDYEWAEKHGVNTDENELLITDPDTAEEAFNVFHRIVTSASAQKQQIGVVLFDSIGAVVSSGELEEDAKQKMAGQSSLITNGIKRVQKAIEKNNILAIVINQQRDNLGSMTGGVKPAGPHALHHHSGIIIYLRPKWPPYKGIVDGQEMVIGYEVVAQIKRTKKNQGSDHVAYMDYYIAECDGYPFGIDKVNDVITVSRRLGLESLKETSKARWEMEDGTKIHGAKQLKAYMDEHPALYARLQDEVIEAILKKGGKIEVKEVG